MQLVKVGFWQGDARVLGVKHKKRKKKRSERPRKKKVKRREAPIYYDVRLNARYSILIFV